MLCARKSVSSRRLWRRMATNEPNDATQDLSRGGCSFDSINRIGEERTRGDELESADGVPQTDGASGGSSQINAWHDARS